MLINKYKDDYKQVQNFGPDGKLRAVTYYDGVYYELPYDEKDFKKNKFICLGFGILFLLIYLGAGSLNPDSSRTIWIVLPYFFMFLPLAYNILGVINLFGLKTRMEKVQYEESIIRVKNCSMAVLVMAAINIILDLIFIFLNRADLNFAIQLFYILLLLMLIIAVIAFGKKYDKMFGGVITSSN